MMRWIVAIGFAAAGAALLYLKSSGPVSTHMVIATVLGVFLTVLVGSGLFAAAFFSSKSGHDQSISDSTRGERE